MLIFGDGDGDGLLVISPAGRKGRSLGSLVYLREVRSGVVDKHGQG